MLYAQYQKRLEGMIVLPGPYLRLNLEQHSIKSASRPGLAGTDCTSRASSGAKLAGFSAVWLQGQSFAELLWIARACVAGRLTECFSVLGVSTFMNLLSFASAPATLIERTLQASHQSFD